MDMPTFPDYRAPLLVPHSRSVALQVLISLIHVIHLIPKREWGVCPFSGPKKLLGLPLTHNSRHVASTFKRLTTITSTLRPYQIHVHRRITDEEVDQIRPWSL